MVPVTFNSILLVARKIFPALKSQKVSRANVEYVVSAPIIPVDKKDLVCTENSSVWLKSANSMPSIRLPIMFTLRVPKGKS